MNPPDPLRVLMEMRPALDGHAGIPQEARLLFRGLSRLDGVAVEGLLQSSSRLLAAGLPARLQDGDARWPVDRRIARQSRVLVSMFPAERGGRLLRRLQGLRLLGHAALQTGRALAGAAQPLTRLSTRHFEDWFWRDVFARTLPPQDRADVLQAGWRVARVPWVVQHAAALLTRQLLGCAVYPRLDTRGIDLLLAETPFPGRVAPGTRLLVRYHDAIPLLMPHTISDKAFHQASHHEALRRNVRDGAWFACVSESTRRDLLSLFPELGERAVTLPNMVSHHYHEADAEACDQEAPLRIPDILRVRASTRLEGAASAPQGPLTLGEPPAYLLMVSTLEPRKNHLGLLAAWEQLRAAGHPDLQLVLVGQLGWDHKAITERLKPWLRRGGVHLLQDVPADELRMLYRHARVTVCPSFGEGFDFSGVEAMRCGGVVAASDIPVHAEVYGEAWEPFSPYDVPELVAALHHLLSPEGAVRREALRRAGRRVSAAFLPEVLLPRWADLLRRVTEARPAAEA